MSTEAALMEPETTTEAPAKKRGRKPGRPSKSEAASTSANGTKVTIELPVATRGRSAGSVNKSAAIKNYLKAYPEASNSDIVSGLAALGVDVGPTQVSATRGKIKGGSSSPRGGKRGRPAGSKNRKTVAAAAAKESPAAPVAKARATSHSTGGAAERLLKTHDLVRQLGGVDKVKSALAVLETIGH
jgi:hypothetical protein